jgi:hypothetical protein
MSETASHLQRPCMLCGLMVDLPAVWACPCGAWRLCYRSACHTRITSDHRDGTCGMPTVPRGAEGTADETLTSRFGKTRPTLRTSTMTVN